MKLPSLKIQPNDLVFIGEGNENIVFGIINTRCCLRLRKTANSETVQKETLSTFLRRLEKDLVFLNFSRRLIGTPFTDNAHPVAVDTSVIDTVASEIEKKREAKRRTKRVNPFGIGIIFTNATVAFKNRKKSQTTLLARQDDASFVNNSSITENQSKFQERLLSSFTLGVKEISPRKAMELGLAFRKEQGQLILYPDVKNTHSNIISINDENIFSSRSIDDSRDKKPRTVCIELKPKQGYREKTGSGHMICRFCLKQYIKINKGSEQFRSHYCPLDLFSGNREKIRTALYNLFETPQNNLRIFVDGIVATNYSNYRYLCELIVEILLRDTPFIGRKNIPQKTKLRNKYSSESNIVSSNDSTSILVNRKRTNSNQALAFSEQKRWKPSSRTFSPELALPLTLIDRVLLLQSVSNLWEFEAAQLMKDVQKSDRDFESLLDAVMNFGQGSLLENDCNEMQRKELKENSKVESKEPTISGNVSLVSVDGFPVDIVRLLQKSLFTMSMKDISLMILIQGPLDKCSERTPESPFYLISPFENETDKWYKCQVTIVDVALKNPLKILDHERTLLEMERNLKELREAHLEPHCCSSV